MENMMHRSNFRLRYFAPDEGGTTTTGGTGGTASTGTGGSPDATAATTANTAKGNGATGAAEDGKGGKDAVLADLAKERDKRQALEKQVADLQAGAIDREALAKALGIKPEETSQGDKLAEQIQSLTQKVTDSERKAALLEVAAAPGEDAEGNPLPAIPKEYHHLLTATETEALQAQAKSIAALVAATTGAGTPGFVAGNGQGQGDGKTPPLQQQLAAAETELAGATRGTPEHRVAQQKVMDLKGQLLFAAHKNT